MDVGGEVWGDDDDDDDDVAFVDSFRTKRGVGSCAMILGRFMCLFKDVGWRRRVDVENAATAGACDEEESARDAAVRVRRQVTREERRDEIGRAHV